jgi:hypothetical protein
MGEINMRKAAAMTKRMSMLCDELCTLLGHKAWTKTKRSCTGKWAGTWDYFLKWEDGAEMFVTNGMYRFEETVKDTIDMLKRTRNPENQRAIMELLLEYEKDDARLAEENNMKSYRVLGLIEITGSSCGIIDWGVRLQIGDMIIDFRETGLSCDIKDGANKLRQTKDREKGRPVWVAGGVTDPDFIIHGVAHSSTEGCYRVYSDEKVTYYPFNEKSSKAS